MAGLAFAGAANPAWGKRDVGVVAVLAIFTAAVRFPELFEPWGGDQGVFGFIAKGMLDGQVPYRDLYSSTGYGIFFAYAGLFKLFGISMVAIHIGDLIASIGTAVVIYVLAKLLYGRECALMATIIGILVGAGRAFSGMVDMRGAWGTYWQLAQRETFMAPLFATAVLFALLGNRRKKLFYYLLSGSMIGLAAVFKFTAVLMLGLIGAYIIATSADRGLRDRLRAGFFPSAAVLAGFLLSNIPFLVYFWRHGALGDMYRAVFVHTSVYAGLSYGNIVADALKGNTYILGEDLFLWLLAGMALLWLVRKAPNTENWFLCGWTIVSVWMVWGQGKFFGYHYLILVCPFSILAAFAIIRFMKTMPTWWESILASRHEIEQLTVWLILVGSMGIFSWNSYECYRWHYLYLSGKISRSEYYEVFNEYPYHLYSFRANRDVAEYLKIHGSRDYSFRDINGGGETVINFLTGMNTATRFTSTWYLFNKKLYGNPLTGQLRQEFITGVKTEKPEFLLLVYFNAQEFRAEYPRSQYADVWDLMDFVERHYRVEMPFRDGRILYRRI